MTLPIKWRVLPGPFDGVLLMEADLVHGTKRYNKQMVMPPSFTSKTWWLAVAAVQAEIINAVDAVKNPPAV